MAKKKNKRELSDIALLQMAEMKSLCLWTEEKMKDFHFMLTTKIDEGTDEEIMDTLKKYQPLFIFLKQMGSDSESWISGSTKRVLDYYEGESKTPQFGNRLEKLFRKEGSKLENFIYIPK